MTLKEFIAIMLLCVSIAIIFTSISKIPKQNTTQIDSLLVENLLLKNKIELLEYKLKQLEK